MHPHESASGGSGPVMALDLGERRIGVAISDPDGRVAVPLQTLERRDEATDLSALADLAAREDVRTVVVGLPISMDGSIGPQAARTQEFARSLADRLGPARSVEMWDERLSTVAAERALASARAPHLPVRQAGKREGRGRAGERHRPRRRPKGAPDALAATLILQSYLDSRSRPTASSAGDEP